MIQSFRQSFEDTRIVKDSLNMIANVYIFIFYHRLPVFS